MKCLAFLLCLTAFGAVRADYIWWCVEEGEYTGGYTAARVRATTDGTYENAQTLAVVLYDEGAHAIIDEYSDGIGLLTDLNDPPSTGNMWSRISEGLDLDSTLFFIELGNYTEGSSGDLLWTATAAHGVMRDYAWLDANGAIGKPGETSGAWQPWHDVPYAPVPEPTTGMLGLIGFAVFALRRRRGAEWNARLAKRKDGGK